MAVVEIRKTLPAGSDIEHQEMSALAARIADEAVSSGFKTGLSPSAIVQAVHMAVDITADQAADLFAEFHRIPAKPR